MANQTNAPATLGLPIGSVIMYAGPGDDQQLFNAGWIICDGRSLSSTDPDYEDLYDAIGGGWGNDQGEFNVPDCRGYFVRGVDEGAGNDPDSFNRTAINTGGNTGDSVGSYEADDFASHNHSFTAALQPTTQNITNEGNDWCFATNQSLATGYAGGYETRPKNVYMYYIIKFKDVHPV